MATIAGFPCIKIIKSRRHITKTCTLVFYAYEICSYSIVYCVLCILYSLFSIPHSVFSILSSLFCEFYVQIKGPTVYLASLSRQNEDSSGALPNINDLHTIINGLEKLLFFRNNG